MVNNWDAVISIVRNHANSVPYILISSLMTLLGQLDSNKGQDTDQDANVCLVWSYSRSKYHMIHAKLKSHSQKNGYGYNMCSVIPGPTSLI